ncbi:MAG: hypothetical protein QOK39_888, partial [Acidimicrobiaceae bacterium]|nr:hypothetical protein [Acidimicrobiaceae bacterium]
PDGATAGAGNGNGDPTQVSTGNGSSGAPSACPQGYTYSPTQFDSNLGEPYPGAPGQAIDVYCGGTYVNTVWQGPAGAPAVNPAQLAQQALASAPFQPVRVAMSPPSTREAVNFPIFLSVGSGFGPVTASASAGGVTSTVNIVPTGVTWDMGDGHSVTCQGPGVPYNPSQPFDSQLLGTGLPPCGYKYSTSSASRPSQAFAATVTVHYAASWTVVGAPGGGALPPVDRSVTLPITVGEIQILNS